MHICTHVYMHTYIHSHTHTHTHTQKVSFTRSNDLGRLCAEAGGKGTAAEAALHHDKALP